MKNVLVTSARPRFTVWLHLDGLIGTDVKCHYVSVAELQLRGGQTFETELAVPVAFVGYKVRAHCTENPSPSPDAEREFAQMLLDLVPDNVWDAGVAAIAARDVHGRRTAKEIIERWRHGEYDAAR